MSDEKMPSGLYLVSTPIGAARDITLRALDILKHADVLAAEDTRTTRKLMDIHGIALNGRRLIAYHDHNGAVQRPKLISALKEGQTLAYVSDAGTPLIADPGYGLAKEVAAQGLAVFATPGPSAVLAALCISGLPTDRFLFAGFLPVKKQARQTTLGEFADLKASLVFYESPKRVEDSLRAMISVYGAERQVALCRELTKKFEQVFRGSLETVLDDISALPSLKGECVIVLGPPVKQEVMDDELQTELKELLTTMRLKDASQQIADKYGVARKRVYALGIQLKDT